MEKNVKEYFAYKNGEIKMPGHLTPRKELTGPLFKNPFLERLTRTTIAIPIVMHLIISTFLFGYGITAIGISIGTGILLLFCGIFFWTFAEYIVHRFLYHTESNSKVLFSIQHSGHGIHHQYPKDPTRFAMPPVPSIIAASLFFLIFWLVMGKYVFVFFPGFIVGYLGYITIHYFQHKFIIPKLAFLRALWEHHYEHHFVDPYSAYGVSTRLWDAIFGTMPKKRKKTVARNCL